MRRTRNSACLVCAAFLALTAAPLPAQPSSGSGGGPPAKPRSQLEEWLEQAVKTHPDIKVAEAKLRTAMAEMEQARSQVMQKVLAQYYAIQSQKIAVEKAELELARLQPLEKSGAVPAGTMEAARANIVTARAKLAELQAQAEQLIGKHADTVRLRTWLHSYNLTRVDGWTDIGTNDSVWLTESLIARGTEAQLKAAAGPMAERIRNALNTRVTLTMTNESLEGIFKKLQQQAPDLVIKMSGGIGAPAPTSVKLQDLPLGAALQWIEDHVVSHRFYVREYGLFLADEKEAGRGAVRMIDFWKGVPKEPVKPGATEK